MVTCLEKGNKVVWEARSIRDSDGEANLLEDMQRKVKDGWAHVEGWEVRTTAEECFGLT